MLICIRSVYLVKNQICDHQYIISLDLMVQMLVCAAISGASVEIRNKGLRIGYYR